MADSSSGRSGAIPPLPTSYVQVGDDDVPTPLPRGRHRHRTPATTARLWAAPVLVLVAMGLLPVLGHSFADLGLTSEQAPASSLAATPTAEPTGTGGLVIDLGAAVTVAVSPTAGSTTAAATTAAAPTVTPTTAAATTTRATRTARTTTPTKATTRTPDPAPAPAPAPAPVAVESEISTSSTSTEVEAPVTETGTPEPRVVETDAQEQASRNAG